MKFSGFVIHVGVMIYLIYNLHNYVFSIYKNNFRGHITGICYPGVPSVRGVWKYKIWA